MACQSNEKDPNGRLVNFKRFNTFALLKKNVKSEKFRFAVLVVGLFTALAVVFSQVFFFEAVQLKEKAKTETSGEERQFISAPSFSLPTSTAVEIQHDFSFITEFFFAEKSEEVVNVSAPLLQKFFSTLLQVIISPNAP